MAGIAIIGYGYWGPNLVRNFSAVAGSKVEWVVDLRTERLEVIKKQYPNIRTTANINEALNDPAVNAVVIATPVQYHYAMAKLALEHGKHVLIEKPMTQSSAEGEELIGLSKQKGLVLMVDHTFLYTGAVRKIKDLIDSGEIGEIQYFDSTRINLGLFQPDINVLWDLAPHDISILFYLISTRPVSVSATGISHTPNELENVAYLTVNYDSTHIAHFSCSWSSPVKIRKILIGGSKKMIVFDDVEPSEKVKIYDTGYTVKSDEDKRRLLVDYRAGDIYVPKLEQREALAGMASDFISAMEKGTTPVSDWRVGLEVVKVLEAAQESIKNKGKEVLIKFNN
jgi:predicted dehydrogenase